jgi:hypothetical protein
MPTEQAQLSFLPWVRQGAAGATPTVDTLGPAQPAVASVDIMLAVNQAAVPPVPVRLRGPADVVGVDVHQILRTDPQPGSVDFEANCFPSIEFDRPDFPWLFTPARATVDGRLRPWLCLIAVQEQDGVQLTSATDDSLPALLIDTPARPLVELPKLGESWAWAHAQTASATNADAVRAALDGPPELSLSRLICPRVLATVTDYVACVVPTFELGRRAGLGLPVSDNDLTAPNALAPAWTLAPPAPAQVRLPVFYSWRFRTGPGGDFALLAQRLRRSTPQGLGTRTVDISQPGFNLPATFPSTATVELEGALAPLTGSAPVLWSGPVAADFELGLAEVVNEPGRHRVIAPQDDPLLAPLLYGRWHAARETVTPGAENWFDELNLDPRWRTAAGLGVRVVQEHQEALMASAWEQAAEVRSVNRRMRHLQLSLAVGERLHARHLSALSEEMTLRFAAPAFSRIRVPDPGQPGQPGRTLTALMTGSALPVAATGTAMRRIGRQRGPLTRRIAAQGYQRSPRATWIVRLNAGDAPAPAIRPAVDDATLPALATAADIIAAIWRPGFRIAAEGQPLPPPPTDDPLPKEWDYPGHFRAAAARHLARIPPPVSPSSTVRPAMSGAAEMVRAQLNPRFTLARLARALVSAGDNVLPPTAPGVPAVGTETVLTAPSFPQPMYEPIAEKSQELLLPGLDRVEPDTVVGLRTNRAFVEAYVIGLNIEMARELLWRGFPTDQQGTYFANFWSRDTADGSGDIDDLRTNLGRALGAERATAPADEFVLLLRSSLLRRYPNAHIYLTPALTNPQQPPGPDILPMFRGGMEPDINFFGFPLSSAAVVGSAGDPGYFVVIQEHPTEPRFGLDAMISAALPAGTYVAAGGQPPTGLPLNGMTWGKNSAHMAEITRRLPVRIVIHASQLVPVT